jgi:hypothetical protein
VLGRRHAAGAGAGVQHLGQQQGVVDPSRHEPELAEEAKVERRIVDDDLRLAQ